MEDIKPDCHVESYDFPRGDKGVKWSRNSHK